MPNVDSSVADSPWILYAMLAVGVLSIIFGGITRGTTGFGGWLNSLRRIGSDTRSADLNAKEAQIRNLATDLDTERSARRADREEFEEYREKQDDLIQEHIKWDWKVYNVLVIAGLLSEESKPPRLH